MTNFCILLFYRAGRNKVYDNNTVSGAAAGIANITLSN